MSIYEIYTDGSAKGSSPNYYGGWGFVVIKNNDIVTKYSGNKFPSTNNEMELTAIKNAIQYIADIYKFGDIITIYTDSNYSLNAVTKWCHCWVNNGWFTSSNKPVLNKELIEEIYLKLQKMPFISFEKVKGHSENKYNNLADELATNASYEIMNNIIKEKTHGKQNY